MLHTNGEDADKNGADTHLDTRERGREPPSPSLQLLRNKSTSNLGLAQTNGNDKTRIRISLDAGTPVSDYDAITRSSLMTDHDRGLGLSGLRRIRQQPNPNRAPTFSSPSSRIPSLSNFTRSSSLISADSHSDMIPSGSGSPTFGEDLSRFPSESLHSFSFAHQSEDLLHSRQNVLKRSIEFMKDRMGWSAGPDVAIASAQARLDGDVETQNMLDLLTKAHLVGAGNIPNADPEMPFGPLTGPADLSGENLFDKRFFATTENPEPLETLSMVSPQKYRAAFTSATRKGSVPKEGSNSRPRQSSAHDNFNSESSSRTPTNESGTTATTSPPTSRRQTTFKRTLTDTLTVSVQQKLVEELAKPLASGASAFPGAPTTDLSPRSFASPGHGSSGFSSSVHGHSTRWVPAAQAIFTTEAKPPWTILAANDLACLVFGVTKAEVRRLGILEVVQEERRAWLERKLQRGMLDDIRTGSDSESSSQPAFIMPTPGNILGGRGGGITAKLLSKPNSRVAPKNKGRRPATIHSGDPRPPKTCHPHHMSSQSRGVLLCGDVVPIRKRNGALGSASLWVKEKRFGLIWVLEEIHEDVAYVSLDEDGVVTKLSGSLSSIWGEEKPDPGMDVGKLIPRIPRQGIDPRTGAIDYAQIAKRRYYTCRNNYRINIPATVEQVRGSPELRVSSFPHIAGIIVVCTRTLIVKSSNSVFSGALFGHEKPNGLAITNLLPTFDKILHILTEEDGIQLTEGIVVPEHSFREASALLALREGRPEAASSLLCPEGLTARHRDGCELKIDVQMRVVKSMKQGLTPPQNALPELSEDDESASGGKQGSGEKSGQDSKTPQSESVYALWITYSRHLHATRTNPDIASPRLTGPDTPLHQPSPGQTPAHTPQEMQSDSEESKNIGEDAVASSLAQQLKHVAMSAAAKFTGPSKRAAEKIETQTRSCPVGESGPKKSIDDFVILEDMGQGAYGQVKLARYRITGNKCILKHVTKKRILVDTWTRDRKLGTVPLEIHVLDYLRRDGLRHPNIVEMEDFFEDDINYYIEMVPHGLPGMDLFDYIELRANMRERECRSIFVQVARAIHHLHTKALVVHRDIKDENVIMDGNGNIKLIDFGSAAYIKSGPFDVFVGTIDYAAPEVLAGKPYGGKEQDVWALGILLYTIIYKENPFYSIDEIMDRDLRVPYTISEESIELIRNMLNRNLEQRLSIEQVMDHPWCQME